MKSNIIKYIFSIIVIGLVVYAIYALYGKQEETNQVEISSNKSEEVQVITNLRVPIVNFDINLLKELLAKENINVQAKEFEQRLELARNWVNDYGKDYQVNLLEKRNDEYYTSLNETEKEWLSKTINLLDNHYETTNDLQTALYDIVKDGVLVDKELKVAQKRYFQILYNMLLGMDQGPKLGLFLMALDKDKIKVLL